jgi:hypothetical protein
VLGLYIGAGERRIGQGINRIEEGKDHAAQRAPRRDFPPEVEDGVGADMWDLLSAREREEDNTDSGWRNNWAVGYFLGWAESLPRGPF